MADRYRILVRGPNWLGDHVMAHPLFHALRESYPGAYLALMAPERVLPLTESGIFDETIPAPTGGAFPKIYRAARKLWNCFDLAITVPESYSAALVPWLARIPERVGFAEPGVEALLTGWLRWPGPRARRHKSDVYLDLVRYVTGDVDISLRERAGIASGPSASGAREYIVLAPGAALPLREWPYFPELLQRIAGRWPDREIVLVGGAAETKWKSRLGRLGIPVTDRIGETSLGELRAICAGAGVVVANDSGVAHVAATCAGAPVVVLFGPGTPDYIRPSGRVRGIAAWDLDCRPCDSNRCRSDWGYQACLRRITPEAVLEAIAAELENSPESDLRN